MRLLLFLLLLPFAAAQEVYYDRQMLTIGLDMNNTLQVTPLSRDYSLKRVSAYLSFYPKEDFQQSVAMIDAWPTAAMKGDSYLFEWLDPEPGALDFGLNTRIVTVNELQQITRKISFPIKALGPEESAYLAETHIIDYSDLRIMNQASELAYGEDDLYIVVGKLAEWVHENVEYSLNTMTADASQSASWVIANREGVCDEITNLFIALCRALGIPARFVSGLSYTTLETFPDRWSPHGWAEVYFPGHGWVPYDVTYGEFGYITPAHIKFKDSLDANKSSTRYEWVGYQVDVRTGKLTSSVNVLQALGRWEPLVNLRASMLKPEAGFRSHNLLIVDIENPQSYYVPTEIILSQTEELEYLSGPRRFVILRPFETRTEYWIVRLRGAMEPGYSYNFTVKAATIRNASGATGFVSRQNYPVYSLNDMERYLKGVRQEPDKTYSRQVSLACRTDRAVYYTDDLTAIDCTVHNIGNVGMKSLVVCLDEQCQTMDLGIGQRTQVSFSSQFGPGRQDAVVTARNDDVSQAAVVQFDVWDRPSVQIDGLVYPSQVPLAEPFTIEFRIGPDSSSVPRSVTVALKSDSFVKEWSVDELRQNRNYMLNVQEYTLTGVSNRFRLLVSYEDADGREYSSTEEFIIMVEDPSVLERGLMFLNRLNISLKYEMLLMVIGVFAAGVVIGLVFRNRKPL